MSITLNKSLKALKAFTEQAKEHLEVIIVGGIAMEYYGKINRTTTDLDAEVKGDVEKLYTYLESNNIPANIGEDISRWGTVSMPPDYRSKAMSIYQDPALTVKVLHPSDFIISKLRRATDIDIQDALFVAKKYKIKKEDLSNLANLTIKNSPKDYSLFVFKRTVEFFLKELQKVQTVSIAEQAAEQTTELKKSHHHHL